MTLRQAAVDSPEAHRLLTDYFEWRAAAFPSSSGAYSVTYPDPAAFEPPRGLFLVADDDAAGVAGVGCGGIRMLGDSATGRIRYEVKHVWLAPDSRGGGLATSLMLELERRARDFGAQLLVLDTHDSLEGAARLYARLGFERVAAYNDNPNATAWYSKSLAGAGDPPPQ